MPEGPDGGALPVVPARSPRRLSLGDGGAGRVPWRGWGREERDGGRGLVVLVLLAGQSRRRSPRSTQLSGYREFGDAHAGYPAASERVGPGAGLRDPFSNEHAYVEDYDPSYSGAEGYDGGVHDGGRAWYAHQAPASEWPLRNEVGGHPGRKGRPLWDRVYDGA